ncbi:class GN sortase [Thalassotalea insulae]|uniref:Class GN sortase n=1 Tax=Thalassotalea insulae TaxID=2056778 RepID=A0ABQ6GLW2_9GAMM|nr:class GN sortase [Thalassotalea insulae]GLX76998.1 class GN sortase [Thalassotalea insulae]
MTGKFRAWLSVILLLLGTCFCLHASWLPTKAWLAEKLIQRSWHHFEQTGEKLKPWPWADTHAIALLNFTRLQQQIVVLNGGDASTLAFSAGAIAPFNQTRSHLPFVVAGHRDSHFSLLSEVQMKDIISLSDDTGHSQLYQVESLEIIDSEHQQLNLEQADNGLVLITCYPFNAVAAGGALRYVIKARRLTE